MVLDRCCGELQVWLCSPVSYGKNWCLFAQAAICFPADPLEGGQHGLLERDGELVRGAFLPTAAALAGLTPALSRKKA
jgi:hypothetical protein